MVDYSFICLCDTLEEALNLEESPQATIRYNTQIHLEPNNPIPYFQITNVPSSIGILNPPSRKVFLVKPNGEETDITDNFENQGVRDVSDRTMIQQAFRLHNLPEMGSEPVYMRIDNINNGITYYSNKFLVTSNDIQYTSRIDYKDPREFIKDVTSRDVFDLDFHLSVGLSFYKNDDIDVDNLSVYHQVTTDQSINTRVTISDRIEWISENMNGWTWKRLKRAFYNSSETYINNIRNYITESFEKQSRDEQSNISTSTFMTAPNYNDTLIITPITDTVGNWTFGSNEPYGLDRTIFNE